MAQPIDYNAAEIWLLRHSNSYNRLALLFDIKSKMQRTEWLRLLGGNITDTDNLYAFAQEIAAAMDGLKLPVREMMTEEELSKFETLKDHITVYRGCGVDNAAGICWSLDRTVAERFPFLNRYRQKEPVLITGSVERAHVVALKLERQESEIISFLVFEKRRDRLHMVDGEIIAQEFAMG